MSWLISSMPIDRHLQPARESSGSPGGMGRGGTGRRQSLLRAGLEAKPLRRAPTRRLLVFQSPLCDMITDAWREGGVTMSERARPLVWTLFAFGVCAPLTAQTAKKISFASDVAPILSQK